MTVDSGDFGEMFAHMAADDQVEVLRAMVSSMAQHKLQWDYIAIELALPENADLMRELRSIVGGMFPDRDASWGL